MNLQLNIMAPEEIVSQIEIIQIALEEIVQEDDINAISAKSAELTVYLAMSAKMLADSKHWQDESFMEIMEELIPKKLSPSILKDLVKSKNKTYNYMVNMCDRLNRTCTHQLDWCRTMISKLKTEMQYLNYNKT